MSPKLTRITTLAKMLLGRFYEKALYMGRQKNKSDAYRIVVGDYVYEVTVREVGPTGV